MSDDDDIRQRCRNFRDVRKQLGMVDLILSCSAPRADHLGMKVLVTGAGWDYLGEQHQRRDFTKGLFETFKPHWQQYHGWKGTDPNHHIVAVWIATSGGFGEKIVASINASGAYAEE